MPRRLFLIFIIFIFALSPWIFAEAASPKNSVVNDLRIFTKAIGAILEGYVEEVQPKKLIYEAVRGMLKSLDRYSEFIDPERYELLKINMKGEYAGVGIKLALLDGVPAVASVQPTSPAEKAGLLPKDKITKIDGVPVEGKSIQEVAMLIRGDLGTEVMLTILREAENKTFDVKLKREKIEVQAIQDVRMVGKRLGYLRLSNWQENTVEQFDRAVKELRKKKMEALIIDLRNNDGGLLQKAVELSERFLKQGDLIVSVHSKIKVQAHEYFASGEHALPEDLKLLILVNQGSASASEIFSAAMQDHKRGIVLGQKTYGKASVQSVIPLDEQSGMKLTTARYVSPKGRVIDKVGIEPDEQVPYSVPGEIGKDQQIRKALEILKKYR